MNGRSDWPNDTENETIMSYLQLLYEGRYNELVHEALPVLQTNKEAEVAFLRLFLQKHATLLLTPHGPLNELFREADKGNKYAQYAVARRIYFENATEDSLMLSYRRMKAAADQGLPDAIAGIALTYEFGDIGAVNRDKADELMAQARSLGSELALRWQLVNSCFQYRFREPQPQRALELANEFIAADEARGIDPNGIWYYYRAFAKNTLGDRDGALEDSKRAMELGILRAYYELILVHGYNAETNTFSPNEQYHEYLLKGMSAGYGGAFYIEAVRMAQQYDAIKAAYEERDMDMTNPYYDVLCKCHDAIYSMLKNAAHLGDVASVELLGDMFFRGSRGFEQSYKKALACYERGVQQNDVSCMEKLWKMMHYHIVDKPLDFIDQVALWGARNESKRLLAETVIAKQEGRLSVYADEIEKYYEPIFDSPDFTIEDDDDDALYKHTTDDLLAEGEDDGYDEEEDDSRWDAWA